METDEWFAHHTAELPKGSQENRGFIEYITGRIPLLLHSLLDFKTEMFDEPTFLKSTQMRLVERHVTLFYTGLLEREPSGYDLDGYVVTRNAHTLFTFVTES